MVYFQDRGQGQTQPPFKPFSQGMFSGGSAFERATGLEDPDLELKFKLARDIAQTTGVNVNPSEYSRDQLEDILARSVGQNVQTLKAQQGVYETTAPAQRRQDFMTLEQINEGLPTTTEAPIITGEQLQALDPSNPRPLTPELQEMRKQLDEGFEQTLKNNYELQNQQKLLAELGPKYEGTDLNELFRKHEEYQKIREDVANEGYVGTSELEPWEKALVNYDRRKTLMETELLPMLTEEELTRLPEKEQDIYKDRLQLQNEAIAKRGIVDESELTPEQIALLDNSRIIDMVVNVGQFLEKAGPGMAKFAYRSLSGGGLGGIKTSYDFLSSLARAYTEGNNPETDKVADEVLRFGGAPVIKEINNRQSATQMRSDLLNVQEPSLFLKAIDGMNISEVEKEALKTVGYGAASGAATLAQKAGGIVETIAELEQTRLGQLASKAGALTPFGMFRPGTAESRAKFGADVQQASGEFLQKLETEAAGQGLLRASRGGGIVMEEIVLSPLYATGTRGALKAAQLATKGAIKGGEYAVRGAGLASPYVPTVAKATLKGAKTAAKVGGKAATTVAGGVAGAVAGSGGGPVGMIGGALAGMFGVRTIRGAVRGVGRMVRGIGNVVRGGAKETAEQATKETAEAATKPLTRSQQIVKEVFEEYGPTAASKLATKMARTADAVGDAELAGYWWDVAGTALNVGLVNGFIEGMAAGDARVGFNSFLLGTAFGGVGGLALRSSLPSNLKYARNIFSKEELALVKNSADREMAALAQANFGDEVRIVFAESQEGAELLARQYVTTGSKGQAYQPGTKRPFRTDAQTASKTGEVAKGSYLVEDASSSGQLKLILYPDSAGRYANSLMDSLPDTLMRGSSNPGARAKISKAVYESIPASQLDAFAKARGLQDYRTNIESFQKLTSEVVREQMRIAGKDVFYPSAKGFDVRAKLREFGNRGGQSELGVYPEIVRAVQDVLQVKPNAKVIATKNNNVWKLRPKKDAVPSGKKGGGPKGSDGGDGGGGGPKGGPEAGPGGTGELSRIVRNIDEAGEAIPTQPQVQPQAAEGTTAAQTVRPVEATTPKAKYSPEIRAKLDELDAKYAPQRESLAADKARLDAIPDSWERRVVDEQIGYSKRSKALGYRYAAERRQILGEDPATAARLAKREKTLYRGKQVAVEGQPAEVVGNVFGKVKVKMADGTERTVARDMVTDAPKTPEVTPEAPTPKAAPSPENVVNYPVRARDIGGGKAEIEVKLRNGDTIPVTVDAELVPNLKSDWSESTVPFQIDEATGQAFIPGRRDLWTNKGNIVAAEEPPIDMTNLSPRDKAIARSEARKAAKKLKEPKEIAELNSQDPDALDWDSLKDDAIDVYSKAPNEADFKTKMAERIKKKKKGGFVSTEWLPELISRLWNSMKDVFDTIRTKYQSSRFAGTRGAAGDLTGKAEGRLTLGDDPLHQLLKDTTNAEKNLKLKEGLKEGVGVAKNPLTRFHNKDGKPIYVGAEKADGGKPFKGWIEETEAWSTPQEVQTDRAWYKELKSNFDDIFGEEDSGKMMMSWLASQQNASPINGMQNMFRVEDRLAGIKSKKGGLADSKIEGILTGKAPEKGFGAKLTDFVDAGFGRDTRTYMGNEATAGKPFVADVHTGRDSGHVDQQTLTRLFNMSKDGDLFIDGQRAIVEITKTKDATIKGKTVTQPSEIKVTVGNKSFELTTDMTGSPSGGKYEGISNWGNKLTDHLNEISWMGGNWTPAEVQAVGWMRTLKQYGLPQGTLRSSLDRNTANIFAEVNYSSGFNLPIEYPGFSTLAPNVQRAITTDVLSATVRELEPIVGGSTRIRGISVSDGFFGGEPAPSVVIKVLGSPEATDLFGTSLGMVSEQAVTFSTTFGVGGKNSRAINFRKANGSAFTPEEIASLTKVKGVSGFTVEQLEKGSQGLILGTKKGTYEPKGFSEQQAKDLFENLDKWAADNDIDLILDDQAVQANSYGNDWAVNTQGEAYLNKIKEIGGEDRAKQIVDFKNKRYKEILSEAFKKHAKEVVTQQE